LVLFFSALDIHARIALSIKKRCSMATDRSKAPLEGGCGALLLGEREGGLDSIGHDDDGLAHVGFTSTNINLWK
jgi:hypothetical protein